MLGASRENRHRQKRHCSITFRHSHRAPFRPPWFHRRSLMPPRRRQRRVVVVAYDRVALFELAIAVEVFGLPRPELEIPWYDFAVCSIDPGPLRSTGMIHVRPHRNLSALSTADTIIIP